MRKIITLVVLVVIILGGTACTKKESSETLALSKSEVKQKVTGWTVYTNPAYRYEFRLPQEWTWLDSGEDGKLVQLFSANNTSNPAVVIKSVSNWQEKYSLEEYYQNQENNLWTDNIKRQEITMADQKAFWFKNVLDNEEEKEIIAWELGDRIVEFEILAENETAEVILNSFRFYGNKTISDLN